MKFKKVINTIILILIALFLLGSANAQGTPKTNGKKYWVEGQIIVKPRAGLSRVKLVEILGKRGGRWKTQLRQLKAHIVTVPVNAEDETIKALLNNPNIEYAEKDLLVELSTVTPNDPNFGSQWFLPVMQVPEAWESSGAGEGITVAILDTGVEGSHPDLVNNLVPGWNVVSNNNDTSPIMWHGTGVAGVVAATSNNSIGISSVAWNAKIMPIRVSNETNGVASYSSLANGILWAADHGADVVNMSYDIWGAAFLLNDAAQYFRGKGGVTVVAAGNANADDGYSDNPYMIAVAATDVNDNKASFSNYGNYIDVTAPGKYIYTTTINGGYRNTSGTSFASPATAGVIALIMATNPELTPEEVEEVLEQSADDLVEGVDWHPFFGHGRVNAAAAVELALGMTDADTQAPDSAIISPQNNAIVNGDVLIEVDANDDTGVTGVDLYVGGEFVGRDLTSPYQFTWDSTLVSDGSMTFVAYAQDSAGNEGFSNSLSVEVVNQVEDVISPTVSFESPTDGGVVSGNVLLEVSATDDIGVIAVDLYADGVFVGTDMSVPYQFSWDSASVVDGNVTFIAYAHDATGNEGISNPLSVDVVNQPEIEDTAQPTVSFVSPVSGSTVGGNVLIEINALDDTGITGVDLYANGQFVGRDSIAPYSYSWDSTQVVDGNVSFTAYAQDAAGNEGVSDSFTVYVENLSGGQDTIAPTISLFEPADGSNIGTNRVRVAVIADDNVAVKVITVYLDGVRRKRLYDTNSVSFYWNVGPVSTGFHEIKTVVEDAAGNAVEKIVTVWRGDLTADTQAPDVTIVSPQNNAIVSSNVLVEVSASDDIGVAGVDLYANGLLVGRDVTAPYQFIWDSTLVSDGVVIFTAYAQDSALNEGISAGISVDVVNQIDVPDTVLPLVSIVSPAAGSTISGTLTVEVLATDAVGVAGVDLYANGIFVGRDTALPYEFIWDSTQVADGNVTFTAYAQDAAENEGISDSFSVNVENLSGGQDTIAPTISLFEPADGSDIGTNKVKVTVIADDNVAVTVISVYLDGVRRKRLFDTNSVSFYWNVGSVSTGFHEVKTVVEDAAGNAVEETVTVWKG